MPSSRIPGVLREIAVVDSPDTLQPRSHLGFAQNAEPRMPIGVCKTIDGQRCSKPSPPRTPLGKAVDEFYALENPSDDQVIDAAKKMLTELGKNPNDLEAQEASEAANQALKGVADKKAADVDALVANFGKGNASEQDLKDGLKAALGFVADMQKSGIKGLEGVLKSVSKGATALVNKKAADLDGIVTKFNYGNASDQDLRDAIKGALGAERDRQMLAGSSTGSNALSSVSKATTALVNKKAADLDGVVAKFDQGNASVQDVRDAIQGALGAEKDRKMLGDSADWSNALGSISKAANDIAAKQTAALKAVVAKFNQGNASVQDVRDAIQDGMKAEKDRQLLGVMGSGDLRIEIANAQAAISGKQ